MVEAKAVAAVGIIFTFAFLILGLFTVLSWSAAGPLAAASIGITSIILALESKERRDLIKQNQVILKKEESLIADEIARIEDYVVYEFTMEKDEKVIGEISSDDYFNVYFLTPRNLTRFENNEEIDEEYGTEGVSKTKISFVPDKPGKFCCIIENEGKEEIDVAVSLFIRKIDLENK